MVRIMPSTLHMIRNLKRQFEELGCVVVRVSQAGKHNKFYLEYQGHAFFIVTSKTPRADRTDAIRAQVRRVMRKLAEKDKLMCVIASLLWMVCSGPPNWSDLVTCWDNMSQNQPCSRRQEPIPEPYHCAGPCPITVIRT
jgi:hypothetical protein